MKTFVFRIYFFVLLLIGSQVSFAQIPSDFSADDMISIKTPDVAAIESVNFLPVNEYTGRINIDIPIYNIDLDGLSIPISISYNSGGVKVNSISSRVGLNWSLNAGGVISREVKGKDDLSKLYEVVENEVVYSAYGFLIKNYSNPTHTIWAAGRDGQPDHFFVSAPGLNTVFTHKSNADPMELSPKGNKIQSSVKFNFRGGYGMHFKFDEFDITSATGFVYNFKDRENSFGHYFTSTDLHSSKLHIANGGGFNSVYSTSIHLSSIVSPKSERNITFTYDSLTVNDHDLYTERKYTNSGNFISHTDFDDSKLEVKLINKIVFDSGEINFYYSTNRLDLVEDKKLTKIEVVDNFGKLIKRVHFVQSYFLSSDNCNDAECLRLRLDELYYTDVNNKVLPGYKFTYNSNYELPRRRSYKQDFLGYYNGATSSSSTNFIPKVYYKSNQGRNSILPFNITGLGYVSNVSTYSLESNVSYAKSASLEKIEYPTGGYADLEYELNSFSFLGQDIDGGGLRIKARKLFDAGNNLKRAINYEYKNEDTTSSGSILFVPLWGRFRDDLGANSLRIYQRSLTATSLQKIHMWAIPE